MSKRNSRTRSVGLILVGLMLGAVTIAPAFANHTPNHTAKQIKRLNKKVKKVNGKFASYYTKAETDQKITAATTYTIKKVAGDGEATIASVGGFSVVLTCDIEPASTDDAADLELRTTVNGINLDDNDGPEFSGSDPFDVADSPYAYGYSDVEGDDEADLEGVQSGLVAVLPNGTMLTVNDYMIGVNMPLGTCVFAGHVGTTTL